MNRGKVEWHQTCYCSPPLRHEGVTIYDRFFSDMEIEPIVASVPLEGESFWQYIQGWGRAEGSSREESIVSVARYVPVRIL